jgi:large subunit ribosomal protein L19
MKKTPDPTKLIKKAVEVLSKKTRKHPEFKVGDTVQVHVRVKEGSKTRIQIFEGLVIKKRRTGVEASFTVRKISYGVGIERVFPLFSPVVEKITIVSKGDVRRARLFYLRKLKGRKARIKSELVFDKGGKEQVDSDPSSEPSSSKDVEKDVEKKAAEG